MPKQIIQTEWNPSKQNPNALLLDAEDVAGLLGCCSKTVRGLAKAGKIKSVRLGRLRKFTRRAVEDFISQAEAVGGSVEE
ncbi:helix-turn-helix domain-containing protein [Poriferisphaera sp. WC338]|uniref:helix-turn-helix domain-containing protein n=1 Tax=Poriferisphaera sp. WC338 TaxID=3425129 RepID=UPI003D8162C4